jgi:hypothetical protein
VYGGNFHLVRDRRRAAVERPAKNVRKAQHIIEIAA